MPYADLDYDLTEEQKAHRDMVREFAAKEIVPIAKDLDRRPEPQQFPHDLYRKLAAQGFIGFPLPKEDGGQGRSAIEYTTLGEELTFWDPAINLLAAVAVLATEPMCMFASPEQKKKYVPKCISGERMVSPGAMILCGAGASGPPRKKSDAVDPRKGCRAIRSASRSNSKA